MDQNQAKITAHEMQVDLFVVLEAARNNSRSTAVSFSWKELNEIDINNDESIATASTAALYL